MRTLELALTELTPDKSLKFLSLPEKEDPDSLIRRHGAAMFKTLADGAMPISAVLFDMLAEGANLSSPEGRAMFRTRLVEAAGKIPDKSLAGEYRSLLLDRFFADRPRSSGKRFAGPLKPAPLRVARPIIDPAAADAERGKILTAILLNHPQLLPDMEEAFCLIDLPEDCARLREAFSAYLADHNMHQSDAKLQKSNETLDLQSLLTHLQKTALGAVADRILRESSLQGSPLPAGAAPGATLAEAADLWWEMFGLMRSSRLKLRDQRDEQRQRYMAAPDDPETVQKFIRLNAALSRAERAEREAE
jgi:DNA primase